MTIHSLFKRALVLLAVTAFLQLAYAQKDVRHLVGIATLNGQQVPVRLDLSIPNASGKIEGVFLNGPQSTASSSGELSGTHLVLHFAYYARTLDGELTQEGFKGSFAGGRGGVASTLELHAGKKPTYAVSPEVKKVSGEWELAVKSAKGESAWPLEIKQGADGGLEAVILKVDGDSGPLFGGWDEASSTYRVSHYGAQGAALYSIKPQPENTLLVTNLLREGQQWTARRPADARKLSLAPPTIATEQTSVTDSSKPLQFSAPDLQGSVVTSNDAKFQHKVVIVAIGGSWCPNCHDEASFLVELYKRYHAQGLEIVNLSFEEEDQLKDPTRLRGFIAKYGIPYTVLVGGTPDQLSEKIPQGKNLNCWPTTFFVGRDGLVKEVHAGFSGPATGVAHAQLVEETNKLIQKLLAEKEVAQR